MSLSALSGFTDTVPVTAAVTQSQAATAAPSQPPQGSGTQPILMVPTKPPLSPAVMAELIGRQTSLYAPAPPATGTAAGPPDPAS